MGYICNTCGAYHPERPTCWKFDLPAVVAEIPEVDLGRRVQQSPDQCVLDGEHFFILGNLDVPIRDSGEFLRWSVWTTLSKVNFERSSDLWETPGRESEKPYFGWLSNQIPGYPPSVYIRTLVHTQPVGIRPLIEVIKEGHQLGEDQRAGISEVRVHQLIHAASGGGAA